MHSAVIIVIAASIGITTVILNDGLAVHDEC